MKVTAVTANSVEFTKPDGSSFTLTNVKKPRISAQWGSVTPAEKKKANKQFFVILNK
jgi:hypothetical protein